jgi:hypothetical protein
VGGYDTSGSAGGVAVSGNYAYVGDGSPGLQVIDVSNPANPQRVGGYDTSGSAGGVAVSGKYAYVADGYSGLQVIDVSNPANPQRVGGNSAFDGSGGISVANGKVFVAAGGQGLVVLHSYQSIRFEQITRQQNGTIALRIAGPPGVAGRIQRANSLPSSALSWSDWLPFTFGESPLDFIDPDASFVPARYYRLTVP